MSILIETDELPTDELPTDDLPTDDLPTDRRPDGDRSASDSRPPTGLAAGERFRGSDLGVIRVDLITGTRLRAGCPHAPVRPCAADRLEVLVALGGGGHPAVIQDQRQARLNPGDFALYDTARPHEVRSEGHGPVRALTLHFPRSLLRLPDSQLERLTAVPMRADAGIGKLTSDFLLQFAAGAGQYSPAEAVRLSTAALEVLTTRLTHELDGGAAAPAGTRREALLARILVSVSEHIGDPELSPRTIAAAHHVSVRYLHKLFQEQGETVAGSIRARRLEGCRRDLADPAQSARPAAAIGARWGFRSAAQFSRAFKAAFGMPPQTYREGVARVSIR